VARAAPAARALGPQPTILDRRAAADDDDEVEDADSGDEELREALVDYMATANQERTVDNQNLEAGQPGTSDDDRWAALHTSMPP
jgi:hypothetical protein